MANRGLQIRNYELHLSWVFPDSALANFFEVKTDKKVLKMERLRGDLEKPFVYFVSYFHPRIGLTGDEDFKRPLYEMLEQEHLVVADLSKEEISADSANEEIAQKLEITPGSPILIRKRFVFDQGDRAMEYNLGYYVAKSFIYTVESRRTK